VLRAVGRKDRPHGAQRNRLRSRPATASRSGPQTKGTGALIAAAAAPEQKKALASRLTRASLRGVSDGAQTRE
jgi:hypothetical protein